MTIHEIRDALDANLKKFKVGTYPWKGCNAALIFQRAALQRAVNALDDYYYHGEHAVKLYCKHLSK